MPRPRVLIVPDDPATAAAIRATLIAEHDVDTVAAAWTPSGGSPSSTTIS